MARSLGPRLAAGLLLMLPLAYPAESVIGGPPPSQPPSGSASKALLEAVQSSDPGPALALLLARRETAVDVNARDPEGDTALHRAAAAGSVRVLQALLAAGADPNATVPYLRSAPLHLAARAGRTAALQALLSAGADVSAADVLRNTPLLLAASQGHAAAVRALLAAGADPEASNALGSRPVDLAAEGGHCEATLALLAAGAEPRTPADALRQAAGRGHLCVVLALTGAGSAAAVSGLMRLHGRAQK